MRKPLYFFPIIAAASMAAVVACSSSAIELPPIADGGLDASVVDATKIDATITDANTITDSNTASDAPKDATIAFDAGSCATTVCGANATCSQPDGGAPTCKCSGGFAGDGGTCANIDDCSGAPCQNGGSCADGVSTYTCTCLAGYSGTTCEMDINECASSPCQNGGTCTDLVNDYSCGCVAGYDGKNCANDINECASSPCQNGGSCTDLVNDYSCGCVAGYDGKDCSNNINECVGNVCANGSTCVDGVNGYTCSCVGGFGGALCNVEPSSCLTIKNANAGAADGIYTIDADGAGGAAPFSAYCDMTTDGGGWTLTARWTGVNGNATNYTHAEVCGASGLVRTLTNDGTNYPVPPDNSVSGWGTSCMVKPGNSTFVSTYGAWFKYAVGAFDLPSTSVSVTYSTAGVLASSNALGLWGNYPATNMFTVIPATTNTGLCGGPGICNSMACPSLVNWNACHWDAVTVQQIFRR